MKVVDVARFSFANDAAILVSLLDEEGIDYSLNHKESSILVPGSGTVLSVLESDESRVRELVIQAGFGKDLLPG